MNICKVDGCYRRAVPTNWPQALDIGTQPNPSSVHSEETTKNRKILIHQMFLSKYEVIFDIIWTLFYIMNY